jgi:hypothetical protein
MKARSKTDAAWAIGRHDANDADFLCKETANHITTKKDLPLEGQNLNRPACSWIDLPLALKLVLVAFAALGFVFPTFNLTFCDC